MANYYIRQGLFEKARDIFEESLSRISTARDFGLVFNSYLKFEEQLLKSEIKEDVEEQEQKESEKVVEKEMDKLINETLINIGDLSVESNKDRKDTKDSQEGKKDKKKKIKSNRKGKKDKSNKMEIEEVTHEVPQSHVFST